MRLLAAALAVALSCAGCSTGDDGPAAGPGDSATDSSATAGVSVVANNLDVPWGLTVLENGAALVGERDTARVLHVPGDGAPELLTTVPGVEPGGEGGLLGLVVPDGGTAQEFYAYVTTVQDNRILHVDTSGRASDQEPQVRVVLAGIPKAANHNGGRLAFGPDGYLYATTGDASEAASAQDPTSLAGKILRITTDGRPAPGNPDSDSPVWSLGHRNVQGLDWDQQGRMWASEFGANDLDEINMIEPGNNYGWPECEGPCGEPDTDFVDPVFTWPTSQASPSGLAVGPDGDLFVAALRGQSLYQLSVNGNGEISQAERRYADEFGRLRSVVVGPGEDLWLLTNNTARGAPQEGDDKLLRVPAG